MGAIEQAVRYALLPAAVVTATAALATRRPPGPTARGAVAHVAAGVVFGVVGVELLPELLDDHEPALVAAGVVAGTLAMVGLRAVTGRLEAGRGGSRGGLLVASGLDVAVDGLLLGVGFALGEGTGRLLALALTIEFATLGLAVGTALVADGWSSARVIGAGASLAGLVVAGAAIGASALAGAGAETQALAVAVGAVALLYLATEELLAEAHEGPERSWFTALFFAGFLVVFLLESA